MPQPLLAEQLAADHRIAQAKQLILDALADQQRSLTGVKPADPARKATYDELINSFAAARGGGLYFPYLGSGIGKGALVELADGSVKYDFITGIGVHFFGHSHPAVVAASIDAATRDTVMQGNLQQNVESVQLSRDLIRHANVSGARLEHCFISTSGAMANENALKIALQKKTPASRILAFENCFMGRTLVLSQITDRPQYREGMPKVIDVDYVPYFDPAHPAESIAAAVRTLKSHIARYPGQHAVMPMELVVGEGGYLVGSREFFLAIIEVLRANKIAVYIDEVQTFGRLTKLFGFQAFGLDQHVDIVTIGKLSQVCATLFTDDFKPRAGLVSQTFTGATSSIVAGQTILNLLTTGDFYGEHGRVAKARARFTAGLDAIAARHANWVRGPYGLGGMIAFTPFAGSPDDAKKLVLTLYDAGVISFIAGSSPSRVRFLMPIGAVTDEDIDAVLNILEATLAKLV
jgi:acetylornithine aminotransferase